MAKRKLSSISALVAIMLLVGGTVYAKPISNDNEIAEIKNVVSEYLEEQTEAQVTLQKPKYEKHIKDQKLKHCVDVKTDLTLSRLQEFDYKVLYDDLEIDYVDVKEKGNRYEVKLTAKEKLQFEHLTEPTLRQIHHEITLEKVDDQWYIIKDDSNDIINVILKNNNLKIDEFKEINDKNVKKQKLEILDNINKKNDKSKAEDASGTVVALDLSYSFDRLAMFNYQKNNWNKRPAPWGNFDGMGGDCTNYVSQIIYAGGAPKDTYGSYTWYYNSYSDRSPSWTGVNQLYSYLVGNTYTGPIGRLSSNFYCTTGDIIQLDFTGDGSYDHSLSIVYQDGAYPAPTITCHTSDRYNDPLYVFSYANARWIKLTNYIK